MPNVTKSQSNNFVSVSYPVREAVLEITHAEHALILMFSHEKVKMIKFIRAQYNLGLYDAEQVVDTVIASAEVKPSVQLKSTAEETEVDWSKVPEGTWIYVRDYETEEWNKRRFIKFTKKSTAFQFVCTTVDSFGTLSWKYAKLIND